MKNEKNLIQIEKKIRAKMHAIKNKTLTPKDSKIGFLFNYIKTIDLFLYNQLIQDYKKIIENLKKDI